MTPLPNYYAHQVFGRRVLAQLPPALRERLEGEAAAWLLGLYGPDPLFFVLRRRQAARLARDMHGRPLRPAAQRLLAAAREERPHAWGYSAGFLCHFALDSRCHRCLGAHPELSHAAAEAELDRALMLYDGLDPLRDTPLPHLDPSPALLETAALIHPALTGADFDEGWRQFRRVCRLQTRLDGSSLSRAVDWLGRRAPRLSPVSGALLSPRPDPRCREATRDLLELLEEEAAPTARAVEGFFAAAVQGGELDGWYDRPFNPIPTPAAS